MSDDKTRDFFRRELERIPEDYVDLEPAFKRWVPRPSRDCRCYAKPANLLKLRVIQGGKR